MSWAIELPKVDANVTRAKIVNWFVREGDSVSIGTPLVEIETEKAVFVIDAEAAGVVRRILVAAGDTANVGARIGVIGALNEELAGEPLALNAPTVSAANGPCWRPDEKIADEYAVPDYGDALLGE